MVAILSVDGQLPTFATPAGHDAHEVVHLGVNGCDDDAVLTTNRVGTDHPCAVAQERERAAPAGSTPGGERFSKTTADLPQWPHAIIAARDGPFHPKDWYNAKLNATSWRRTVVLLV